MGALLDAVPAGGADHTEHHRDLATAIEAVPAAYQPLDSDLTAIAALTTTAYGRGLLSLANQAALQAEAGGSALVAGVDYPTRATVTLSSAQILDLHNTPITLVAAPGAGKFTLLHRGVAFENPGGTPYTSLAGTWAVEARYVGNTTNLLLTVADVPFTPGGSSDNLNTLTVQDAGDNTSGFANTAITLGVYHDPFTDGDGTLTVTVWYTIEDVPA